MHVCINAKRRLEAVPCRLNIQKKNVFASLSLVVAKNIVLLAFICDHKNWFYFEEKILKPK